VRPARSQDHQAPAPDQRRDIDIQVLQYEQDADGCDEQPHRRAQQRNQAGRLIHDVLDVRINLCAGWPPGECKADWAVIGDLHELIPAIIEEVKSRRA
jgi:hypothetical protein